MTATTFGAEFKDACTQTQAHPQIIEMPEYEFSKRHSKYKAIFDSPEDRINHVYIEGKRPLILATLEENIEMLEFLLQMRSDDPTKRRVGVNKKDENGLTALMHACLKGFTRAARMLIDAGAHN